MLVDFIYLVCLKVKNSKEYIRIYSEKFPFPFWFPATLFLPFKAVIDSCILCSLIERFSVLLILFS